VAAHHRYQTPGGTVADPNLTADNVLGRSKKDCRARTGELLHITKALSISPR